MAAGSTWSFRLGLLFIMGSGWCSQTLKVEEAYLSMMYCFSFGRFSSVAGQGREGLEVGGSVRAVQEHCCSPGTGTPELVQGGREAPCTVLVLANSAILSPILGKASSTTPRSVRVDRER